jgi:transcriptional regulator GlxA family with amidase domain
LLHVRRATARDPRWIDATLGLIASEIEARPPGHRATVGRLADVLFVQALRAYAAAPEAGENGWLRALVAPRIGEVLQRMHERPAERWTLGRLARIAGMSRSAFAARFSALVGEPPLAYLTNWRMHRALRLLQTGEASMREVAATVGYANESSFGKAFRRAVGMTAGEARRRAGSAATT